MKDRHTGRPGGFGFITYVDPSVVDTVIVETHNINDKQVEIKRTIPKGFAESKDFRTKKGGIPTAMDEDEFKGFFSKYGKVSDCEIIRDHVFKRSRGFGYESGPGAGYGGPEGLYGNRTGYGGSGRYQPYGW